MNVSLQQTKVEKKNHEINLRREQIKRKKLVKLERKKKRLLNSCRSSFKSLKRAPFVVSFQLFLLVFIFVSFSYLVVLNSDFSKFSEIGQKFEFYFSLVVFLVFFFLGFVRIFESSSVRKRIKHEKYYSKKMPLTSTPVVQEAYIGVYCRKCVHYWISLALGSLAFIAILYVLIIGGGEKLAKKDSTQLAIFKKDTYSSFSDAVWKDWSTKLVFCSFVFLILDVFQYLVFNGINNKKIRSFELTYGKEKLINDCLLCYRINKINKRYKIFSFSVVCFVGCAVYIIFKRAICVAFDKSFGL